MSQTLARLAALAIGCCLVAPVPAAEPPIRVATFNLALYGTRSGEILERLKTGSDAQAQHLAEIIQRVRPDVLVLNEIDYDPKHEVLNAFAEKYLAVAQHVSGAPAGPAKSLDYPHRYTAPPNTGHHSGFDLDRNGDVDATPGSRNYGSDCWGYGVYEGQYAFAVLSRFPIDEAAVRTFQNFHWRDMPGALLPDDSDTPAPADWYSAECLEKFPLSSKNHCDVPITVAGRRIHLLLCHPTPPVFDGAEDRNGRRNQDELRFWIDYVASNPPPSKGGARGGIEESSTPSDPNPATSAPSPSSIRNPASSISQPTPNDYFYDDLGQRGALPAGESFIILGDLNGDPHDGQGVAGITALLASPRLLKHDFPASAGAAEAARLQGGANSQHQGDPRYDTEDPGDNPGPGNLHLDYILPSADLSIKDSGVFWPKTTDPLHPLVAGDERPASSDHRLIWADVTWPAD